MKSHNYTSFNFAFHYGQLYCHNPTQHQPNNNNNLTRLRLDSIITPNPPHHKLLIGRELIQPKIKASHWSNSYSYH